MSQTPASETSDKTFYDAEAFDPAHMESYQRVIEAYVAKYREVLASLAQKLGRKLRTLELGAGSCTLSLTLSREPWIESMRCVDISAHRMSALAPAVAQQVGGRIDLLSFGEGNFTDSIDYADGAFDVVLFDAALHHSRNIWTTLQECHRVLSEYGLLIAQREQYAAPLTYAYALHRLLRTPEVAAGVSENAYLKAQYDYYLRAAGFRPTFIPVSHGRFTAISFLNGLLFSKWVIVAERRPTAPVLD